MKQDYLQALRDLLDGYDLDENEKDDIIADYDDMYDNWIELGMTNEEVEDKLGKPKDIVPSLTEGVPRVISAPEPTNKIIAITPFISLVIFFVLGFGFDLWVYSWMAFFLIPLTAIIVDMSKEKDPHLTTALSPFITVIAYFILGFSYNLWHPGWLVFLLIPLLGIINSRKEMKFLELLLALSPFAAVFAYIYIGEQGYYHPGWLIFFVIPFLGAFFEKNATKKAIVLLSIAIGVPLYLYLGNLYDEWYYTALVFSPLVLFYFFNGNIVIMDKETPPIYKYVVLITLALYFGVSFLTGLWVISWLIFFIIPVFSIIKEVEGDEKVIAITPFIATTIFMLLGYFLGAWAWAWLAFLIIPVVAILKEG